MGDVRLSTPRLKVLRDGFDDLEALQTTNADLVLWDRTRAKHRWPKIDEAPFLWLTFLGWAAARRTGAIPTDLTYEAWEAQVVEVSTEDDDDEDGGDVVGSPTQPDLGLD